LTPFLVELGKVAIAVVPEGNIYPKERICLGAVREAFIQGAKVTQGFFFRAGRGAEEERLFPGYNFRGASKEVESRGVGERQAFPDEAFSD